MRLEIGVLAVQGAFAEHAEVLRKLGATPREVRLPGDLDGLDGLIIPGGESTTITKLLERYDLVEPIREFARTRPVWGTCAGMIVMASRLQGAGPSQEGLGLIDATVSRNAFGRQVDSFEERLEIDVIEDGRDKPFPAVFIRAPKLLETGSSTKVLAELPTGEAVAAIQGNRLVTAFHPELSGDHRFHRFFLDLAARPFPQKAAQ